MSPTDTQSAREDIAFMRKLLEDGERSQMTGGIISVLGGGIYGLQCLVQWAAVAGVITLNELGWMITSFLPTVVFLTILTWYLVKSRHQVQRGTDRSINAVFGALGVTNLVLLVVIGSFAARESSMNIYEIYPAVVFALQGGGWMVAWWLRRELWLGAVAAGWFASAIALGFLIGTTTYILVAALSLFAFLMLPGFALIRAAWRNVEG